MPDEREKSAMLTLTVSEINALLIATMGSDMLDEPDDYDQQDVAALKRARELLKSAYRVAC